MPSKKIIIFGTGEAGKNFILKNTEHTIIAASDNDSSRWQEDILGIPIIEPSSISRNSFDLIVITSTWASSIYQQLTKELNIDPAKVLIPPKTEIKNSQSPFVHEGTRDLGHQLIICLTNFFLEHKILAYVDFGTLLGIYRDGEIISWDDDIDFAVNDQTFDHAVALIDKLRTVLPSVKCGRWKIEVTSQDHRDVSIIVSFVSANESMIRSFHAGIARRKSDGVKSEVTGLRGMLFSPSSHFEDNQVLEFKDAFVITPKDVEAYLTFVYGDWRQPKQNMSFNDYEHVGEVQAPTHPMVTTSRVV